MFTETRNLLGAGSKVLEVAEDEQDQAPEVAAEFYPASAKGPVAAECAATRSPSDTIPTVTAPHPTTSPLPTESGTTPTGRSGSAQPLGDRAAAAKPMWKPLPPANNTGPSARNGTIDPNAKVATSLLAHNNGNGSAASSEFNQLRNEFLTTARRVATTKKQATGEVVEWVSGVAFKYGDVGRMTEADSQILRRPPN